MTRKRRIWAALWIFWPAIFVLAQTDAKPSDRPALTELERTKLENFNLKFTLLQQQQMDLQQQYRALLDQVRAEHPGWVLNPQTSQFDPIPAATQTTPHSIVDPRSEKH